MVRETFHVGANPAAGKPIPRSDFGIEPVIELINPRQERRLTLRVLGGLTLMSGLAIPLAAPRLLAADIMIMVGLTSLVGFIFVRGLGGGLRYYLVAALSVAGAIVYYRFGPPATARWIIAVVAQAVFAQAFAQHYLFRTTVHPVDLETVGTIRNAGTASARHAALAIGIGGVCFAVVPPLGLFVSFLLVVGHLLRLARHPRQAPSLFAEAFVSWCTFDYLALRGATFRSPAGSWHCRIFLTFTAQFLLTAAIGTSLYGQAGIRSDSSHFATSDPISLAVLGPFMFILASFPTGLTILSALVASSPVLITADHARAGALPHLAWDVITNDIICQTKPQSILLGYVTHDRTPVTLKLDKLVYGTWLLGRPGSGKTAAACKILRWVVALNQFADIPPEPEDRSKGGA